MSLVRRFIRANDRLSERLDLLLPGRFRIDGNSDFQRTFAPKYLKDRLVVYDVGGGKHPFISREAKTTHGLTVIGLDISREELNSAQDGAYDQVLVADISAFRGDTDADVVICRAVLEHVQDINGAFAAISSCLKKGGTACVFVPSRNALFARLNIMLPQRAKEFLLYAIFPETRKNQGFPSYYTKCTPGDFAVLAEANGMEVIEAKYYYVSKYFSFFVPLYVLWRIWILCFYWLRGAQAAETFSVALRKR